MMSTEEKTEIATGLRIPVELHEKLKALAKRKRMSLNSLILNFSEAALDDFEQAASGNTQLDPSEFQGAAE
jgi:predicted DNA-binding protein